MFARTKLENRVLLMDNLTELYCLVDDFCKNFDSILKNHSVPGPKRKRQRATQLSLAEMVTIMILFHQLRYRQFKVFYQHHVLQLLHKEFPNTPSYQRDGGIDATLCHG
ncbi:MAG: hypothetical protein AB2992_03365 [Candidatus Symbiodolus clandestinus]